jgi:Arc/MetJ-type ribon-helix-helix transcriptional regulator/plasmid stabilization system protein ParE
MANSLNIQLTAELRRYVDERASDDDVYATPSEYVRDLIRRDRAQRIADGIVQGLRKSGRGSRLKSLPWIFLTRNSRFASALLLSSIAVSHLREHKRWSIARFGQAITKKYFEDLDKAFQYIADHYASLPARKELTGDSGLGIHPIREHFVIFCHCGMACTLSMC